MQSLSCLGTWDFWLQPCQASDRYKRYQYPSSLAPDWGSLTCGLCCRAPLWAKSPFPGLWVCMLALPSFCPGLIPHSYSALSWEYSLTTHFHTHPHLRVCCQGTQLKTVSVFWESSLLAVSRTEITQADQLGSCRNCLSGNHDGREVDSHRLCLKT